MTRLEPDARITRETAATERGIPLVVELHDRYLTIRQKGHQTAYAVGYDAIFWLGIKKFAQLERAERGRK